MKIKTDISAYWPFVHENFDYLKSAIELGRSIDNNGPEGRLASALLYVNAIDYVAGHILQNLKTIAYLTTLTELSIVFRKDLDIDDKPLGWIICELKKYEFPDKEDFIIDLTSFNKLRKNIIHNLLKNKNNNLTDVDKDLNDLRVISERILSRYDTIVEGVRIVWSGYTDRINKRRGLVPLPQNEVSSI